MERMRSRPIIWSDTTKHLFRQCIADGRAATFYEVPLDVWAPFRALAGLSEAALKTPQLDAIDNELSDFEGELKSLFVMHRHREAWLRDEKIKDALSSSLDGHLHCEAPGCGFDFENVYGDIGRHFAEVHHLKPLADTVKKAPTFLVDLAIVCANCHRMIHRGGENRPMIGLIKETSAPDV